jgi:novobiocin biosynthesis protein NovU/D-mycarose 3-C-methyltransferase
MTTGAPAPSNPGELPEDVADPLLSSVQKMAERVRRDYPQLSTSAADVESWERKTCRACGANDLSEILSLGDLPPANAYVPPSELGEPEPRFPLSLRLCGRCGMCQLGHVVPADSLFRSYLFFTSSSLRMIEHFSLLMTQNADEFVGPGGLVVEIGSNDGSGLASLQQRNVRVLGVDPSRNISVMAAARGVPTIAEFFTEALANEIVRVAGRAELIVGCNVLGHIDDLDDVCRGLKTLLAEDGAFVFEVPYLGDMLDRTEYDTIYHEHLSYFAIRPLAHLFQRNGLRLDQIQFFPVHGGTLRGTVVHGEGRSPAVEELIAAELDRGLGDRETYATLALRVDEQRVALRQRLEDLRAEGKKVIGYGAPAKGSVVLNFCGIGTDLLPVVLDSTPAKQGLHVPGTHQPILPPSALEDERPDVLLLLAWNHADEIVAREHEFRARGGRFLTPHVDEL